MTLITAKKNCDSRRLEQKEMDIIGIEPMTSPMQRERATNCAICPLENLNKKCIYKKNENFQLKKLKICCNKASRVDMTCWYMHQQREVAVYYAENIASLLDPFNRTTERYTNTSSMIPSCNCFRNILPVLKTFSFCS